MGRCIVSEQNERAAENKLMNVAATTRPTAPALQKETTVGNYFVSNYPPFSFWKSEYVPELHAALERPLSTLSSPPSAVASTLRSGIYAPQFCNGGRAAEDGLRRTGQHSTVPLGLYVHIPFCRKRCHFCYFKVYTDKDSAQIRKYLDAVLAEFELYARRPFIGGRKLDFIYFGGGTPSYLSIQQLRHLIDGMKRLLPWDDAEEVAFEGEPGTLTGEKLKAIRDLGVTRLSLGVENFDDHILEINGRAHHSKEIARAYAGARAAGFPQINIDLIAGMMEETEANWHQCVRKTIELSPDSVTIYEMEIPYNTTIYKQMKTEGKLVAPVADWETKRGWVNYAFREFENAGYTVGSAYTVVKDPSRTKFVYRDRLWAGADLLSIGVASFGHIGGTHYQNHHDFEPYLQAVQQGKLPIWRALTPSEEE